MTDHESFPRRSLTRVSFIRGCALRAGDEWLGEVRRQQTNDLSSRGPGLPLGSANPSEGEQAWNIWVDSYAEAVDLGIAGANYELRELFRKYREQLDVVLREWVLSCLNGGNIPAQACTKLSFLLMNGCGWRSDEILDHITRLHNEDCPSCGMKR
jgi:hypothetical protein